MKKKAAFKPKQRAQEVDCTVGAPVLLAIPCPLLFPVLFPSAHQGTAEWMLVTLVCSMNES